MLDNCGRKIEYLRVSITDRCNLRCLYCMPEGGVPALRHKDILSYEEIMCVVRVMTTLGVRHVRVTGGEPMARQGCLNHTRGLDLRDMLRSGADDAELEAAIRDAIAHKPKRHEFYQAISDGVDADHTSRYAVTGGFRHSWQDAHHQSARQPESLHGEHGCVP